MAGRPQPVNRPPTLTLALALEQRRTVLVLGTISGSGAARLHERGGWEKFGDIPAQALMPDGAMAPTTVYTKRLD